MDVTYSPSFRSRRGNVSGVTQAYGLAFIGTSRGWVVDTDQTVAGQYGNCVIEATTDGGRSWTRQYQTG